MDEDKKTRPSITAERVVPVSAVPQPEAGEQMDLFTDYAALERQRAERDAALAQERQLQTTMLALKKRFGKNAVLKGMDLLEGATTRARNGQVGGHRA